MSIILASSSPRRKELMERMGLEFTIRTAQHDETMNPAGDPADEVADVSRRKASAIQPLCTEDDIIVAADTVVVCDGLIMGKPHDFEDAVNMLHRLSGREHQVMTGLTVSRGSRTETRTVITAVRFRPMSDAEIRAYVATGEPMDKAGAYGVQGLAAMFIEGLDGDFYNVMGLPLCTLAAMLRGYGVKLLGC
ncbi:MAG: septum formation inhibitor Maf [Clostridiales bacterium]|nr:septum formation inhibitor Maf [Clostridiales bacterium]